jgi:hypothetical protein
VRRNVPATLIRALLCAATLVSCAQPQAETVPAPETIEAIPVYEIVPGLTRDSLASIAPSWRPGDPLASIGATRRVTLTATNADARALLLALARESGVNLVVSPDVAVRVNANFNDVPAVDAMRAIIAEAGLSLLTAGPQSPWPPVVFYQLPVNINRASVETIVARFGVSAEMAKWIVESRSKP